MGTVPQGFFRGTGSFETAISLKARSPYTMANDGGPQWSQIGRIATQARILGMLAFCEIDLVSRGSGGLLCLMV